MAELLLDAGNSRLKWARLAAGALGPVGVCGWAEADTDELLTQLLDPLPQRVLLSAVGGGAVLDSLCGAIAALRVPIERAQWRGDWSGLRCGYRQPAQLGIDRWLALVAGWWRSGQSCVVIDLGTAATVDLIDERGQHLGGCIFAGGATQRRALHRQTDALPAVASNASAAFARDTAAAIAAGTDWAVSGAVAHLIEAARAQPGCATAIPWLTGGEAAAVCERLALPSCQHAPALVLEGLALHQRGPRALHRPRD